MLIIPAIDIYENKIVRLQKGDFGNITFYKNSPLEQAKLYENLGFKIIHIVDLAGSKSGKLTIAGVVEEIKKQTNLKIEFGGGVRDIKSAHSLFSIGIDYLVIGSLSLKNKREFEIIINNFSGEKIIAAIDSENELVKVSGWTEKTPTTVYEHIDYCRSAGVEKYLCTDISKDGTLEGTNIELYKKIMKAFPGINLIASGGIKDIDDIEKLRKINPYGVVVGKAIYENKINMKELAELAV